MTEDEPVASQESNDSQYYSVLVEKFNSTQDKAWKKSKDTVAEKIDDWLLKLHNEIKSLNERVTALETENKNLKDQLHAPSQPKTMSQLFNNNKSNDELHVSIVKKIETHLQQKSKIENNIVITSLPDNKNDTEDTESINEIMGILDIDTSKVLRKRRIRRKPPVTDGTNTNTKNLPELEMMIVELVDQTSQQKAVSKSSKLKSNDKMKKVYINPDLTPSQLNILRDLRKQRNALNENLPNECDRKPNETNEGRHRYDVSKKGSKKDFRFHYGIRNLQVVRIFERQETKEARESQTAPYQSVQQEVASSETNV